MSFATILLQAQASDLGIIEIAARQSVGLAVAIICIWLLYRQAQTYAEERIQLNKQISDLQRQVDKLEIQKNTSIQEVKLAERSERLTAVDKHLGELRNIRQHSMIAQEKQIEVIGALTESVGDSKLLLASIHADFQEQKEGRLTQIEARMEEILRRQQDG